MRSQSCNAAAKTGSCIRPRAMPAQLPPLPANTKTVLACVALVVAAGGSTACRMTWELVPPKPNELTPAIGLGAAVGQAPPFDWTSRLAVAKSIAGLGA